MVNIMCNTLLSKSCCLDIVFPNSLSLFIMMFYHMYWKLNLYWCYWQTVEDVYHSSAMSHHSYSQTLPNIANECLHNYSQPLSRTPQNTNAEVSVICTLCVFGVNNQTRLSLSLGPVCWSSVFFWKHRMPVANDLLDSCSSSSSLQQKIRSILNCFTWSCFTIDTGIITTHLYVHALYYVYFNSAPL